MAEPRTPRKPIAVLQGADSVAIQRILGACVERWRNEARGVGQGLARIVGVIEEPGGLDRACAPGTLRNLTDDALSPIYQDLGPGAASCALDSGGLVAAGERVRRDIATGCDLVVLSKFGKLEAESGSGLRAAFADALAAGVPVLTSVAPKFMAAWDAFAAPYHQVIQADDGAAIDAWWHGV